MNLTSEESDDFYELRVEIHGLENVIYFMQTISEFALKVESVVPSATTEGIFDATLCTEEQDIAIRLLAELYDKDIEFSLLSLVRSPEADAEVEDESSLPSTDWCRNVEFQKRLYQDLNPYPATPHYPTYPAPYYHQHTGTPYQYPQPFTISGVGLGNYVHQTRYATTGTSEGE